MAAKTFKTITLVRKGPIDILTLNRPDVLNAMSPLMIDELLHYFQGLENHAFTRKRFASEQPRVVILRAEGKGFCAGLDITTEDGGLDDFGKNAKLDEAFRAQRRISEIVVRMRRCPQPIIALIHGATCGGGLALALGADVRLSTNTLKANVAMAAIGLSGNDIGISYFLPRVVGQTVAAEMILTARFIDAARAEKVGLVAATYPSIAELEKAGEAMAQDMLKLGVMGLELSKQGLNASLSASSLETQVMIEDRQQVMVSYDGEFVARVKDFATRKGKSSKL
jgi:enoyl-CoA hydratase/carnithine racemase